jgi:hypothetical protein
MLTKDVSADRNASGYWQEPALSISDKRVSGTGGVFLAVIAIGAMLRNWLQRYR